jgi:hypothetical protein
LAKLKPNEYLISFTAGGLLAEETRSVIAYLNDVQIAILPSEIKQNKHLKTNSQASRQRVVQELKKRYHVVGQATFDLFQESDIQQQNILIFYSCTKIYTILFDFMFGPLTDKWLTRDLQVNKADVMHFLDLQSNSHPEIERWTETTREKVTTVMIRMLKEVGLLQRGELQQVEAPDSFWQHFVEQGDAWFLQAMLLSKEDRTRIVHE